MTSDDDLEAYSHDDIPSPFRRVVIPGEHGIGQSKREYLSKNLGSVNIDLMKAVKSALDPTGVLNPGKVI